MATQYERQTAVYTDIATLLASDFVKGEAQMQPSYVATKDGQRIGRAHIIAVIVSVDDGVQAAATVDDGSGKIVARSFENPDIFSHVQLGDVIRIIGKVRAYNEQVYLIPEIVKKIEDKAWVKFHTLSRKKHTATVVSRSAVPEMERTASEEMTPAASVVEETVEEIPIDADDTQPESPADDVLRTIASLDTGDGAAIEAVIGERGGDAEKIIQNLLETGEIFEIRPGRVKVLE